MSFMSFQKYRFAWLFTAFVGIVHAKRVQPASTILGQLEKTALSEEPRSANPLSKCAHGDEQFDDFTGCKQVHANGFTFDCRFGPGTKGDVMLLHGFPEWSGMYVDLMKALSEAGYRSVACDQRGYSPGASPGNEEDYNYEFLRDDIFAVASAVGFDKFHLVTHDHGSVLGWWTAGSERGQQRVLSITGMSVPHDDAFSAGLFGPKADLKQQIASQYFSMFTLPDSASIRGYFWYNLLGRSAGGFEDSSHFQKALWWYNGAMAVGVLSAPPVMSTWTLTKNGALLQAGLRTLFGAGPEGLPEEGRAASSPTGIIHMPALYVCGSEDPAILCNRPFALETKEYCKGTYSYFEVVCGHDPMNCAQKSETTKVIARIVQFISEGNKSRQ